MYVGRLACLLLLLGCIAQPEDNNQETRADGAIRLTHSHGDQSYQNLAFAPDGRYILFTRFLNGHNKRPSELVKINVSTLKEYVVISAQDADDVNVPGPTWIQGKICLASDRAGASEEIYVADPIRIAISSNREDGAPFLFSR